MCELINKWRFYGLGEAEYKKALERVFSKNISSLRRTNAVISILLTCFIIVPVFIEKNLTKTLFFIGASAIAALLYFIVRYKYRKKDKEKNVKKGLIYLLISLTYANVISFGIYLGVWANPGNIAGSFFGILICALLLFIISPIFHHCLITGSMIVFIIIVSIVKTIAECRIDIPNVLFTGTIGLIFGWHVIMNKLSLASIANKMEDERDSYYDQSTVDELTQLKNRRDFMNTFQRALSNHRPSDNFLCIAILDIDYFKRYNDYYGHPKGDECLRIIGRALKDLQNKLNIYAARIGGEEFALIWFEEEAANVQNIASQVNEVIRGLNIPHEKSDAAPHVTVSIGIYVVQCGISDDIHTLYNLADKALYSAKKNGRNRAVISLPDHLHTGPASMRETA
jgi:diguanylate cyclase (GGDEF)-like protein